MTLHTHTHTHTHTHREREKHTHHTHQACSIMYTVVEYCLYSDIPTETADGLDSHSFNALCMSSVSMDLCLMCVSTEFSLHCVASKIPILIFSGSFDGEMVKWEQLQLNSFLYRYIRCLYI